MDLPTIEKLSDLLRDYLGSETSVLDHETSTLTAFGENYSSIIMALKIRIKNKHKIEILDAIAKIPPPSQFLQQIFNTPVTFRNEIVFYKTIVPELKTFLHERGLDGYLDCFSEFFGSRLSLNPGKNEVDDGAVILLENLKVLGYEMVDRTIGFDLETSKAIIKTLAKFHASPLAMKLLKPEAFQKIRALFTPYTVFEFDDAVCDSWIENSRRMIERIDSCKQYVERVVAAMKASAITLPKNSPDFVREPFATIIHTDIWINNFMVRYDEGSTSCKILDFQVDEYGSLARDVIFFLYTAVQIPALKENYEELVELYYQTIVEDLTRLGCDAAPFSREELDEEIGLVVKQFEFFHCLMMLEPLYASADSLKELDQYKEEDVMSVKPLSVKHLERAGFIVEEFVRRKWI